MAITQCPDCGKDVSTMAATCPHCGYPLQQVTPAPAPPPAAPLPTQQIHIVERKRGPGCLLVAVAGILVLWAIGAVSKCQRDSDPADEFVPAPSAMPVPTSTSASASTQSGAENQRARDAAVAKFRSISVIRDASWVRDNEFWILVNENGEPWGAVADQACAWIRSNGYVGRFSVSVMDASAALNKRAKQLAHAPCN